MSKYLIFISLWVLIVAQMNAQSSCWKIAQEYTCSEFVFDIKFTDTQHGWVLGNNGYILHTDDGGSSWSQQTSNITSVILRGYFFNNSLGFTSGANYICKTTDGGQTWTPTDLGNVWLLDIFFINTSTGWAAGRTYGGNGIVFKTNDGGATWQSITFPSTMPALGGVFFVNSNTGWIVGSGGSIYKTTNGGNNWSLQPSPTTNQLNNVFFLNTQLGWVSAGTMMLKTQNGGTTWDSISPILNEQHWPSLANQPIRFFDANNGVCMDHITNDGGLSWHRPCGDFSYGWFNTWAVSCFTSLNNGWVLSDLYSAGGGVFNAQISNLVNTPQPPPIPNIFFPNSNAYDIQSDTRIAWEADIHCSVDSFHISVGTSPGGQDVVGKFSIPVSHESKRFEGSNGWAVPCNQNYSYHVPIRNLPQGTKLYASVSASNSIGESSPHIVAFTTIDYQENCTLQEDIRWDTLVIGLDTMLRITTPLLPVSNEGIIYHKSYEYDFPFDSVKYVKVEDRFGRKERALKLTNGWYCFDPYKYNPIDFTVSVWMKNNHLINNGNAHFNSLNCFNGTLAPMTLFAPDNFSLKFGSISSRCLHSSLFPHLNISYGNFQPDDWSLFTLTYKDSTATVYINGVKTNEKYGLEPTKGLLSNRYQYTACIGAIVNNTIIYDDFLLFYRALDSNEVRQLYEFKPPLLNIDTTICAGQSFDFLGNHYDTTGCYQITLPYEHTRGCDSTIIVNLTVEPLPTPATGPDFTHCPQSPLYLPGSGAGTPFWSGPNGFTANTLNPVVNNPVSGVYRLTLTNSAGCSASDTVNIAIGFPNHAEIAPPAHEISCAQPTLTLEPINLVLGTCSSLEWAAFNGGHFVGDPSQGIVDQAGLYRLIITDPCGGCPDTAFVTVASAALTPPGAVAVGATLDCVHQSVVVEGSSPMQNVNYSWSGPNGFSANSAVANVAIPGLYTLTVTDPSGCSSTATAIVVQDLSLPDVTATDAVINCTNTHVQVLGESVTLGATFSWTGPDAFSAITPLIDVSVPGIYTLTVTGINGCTATTTVTVSQDLSLPSIVVSPVKICQGQSALLTATVSNFLQINWFDSTGGTLLGTDATLSVLPVGSGTVNYVVVATAPSGCTASATAIVEVGAPLNVQVSGPDTVCVGEYAALTASGAEFYLWPNGATTATLIFYPSQGQNGVQLEASNSFGCNQVINNIIYGKPVLDISIQGDNPLCIGMRDTLIASGNNLNTFLWAPGGGTFNSLVIEPLVTTTYYVTSNKIGFCQGKDSVTVEVRSLPEANAGVDLQVCMGSATILGNLPPGGAGMWTALDGGAVTEKNSAQTQAIDLESGINRFEWKISVSPCMGVRTDTVAVFLADQIPIAYADDTLLTEVQPVELSLLSNDILPAGFPGFDIKLTEMDDMGTWVLASNGMLRFEPGNNFSGMANAEYEICNKICPEICDAAAVQLFLHRPEDDLGETQVITPNGDAKNDVLIFDYLDQYPDNSIIVFNRWGQRVYESKPYPNNEKDGWKGDWHGKPLPAGTYYFILNLAGSDERVWGNILVLR